MLNREKWAKEISEIKKDFDFKAVDRLTNRLIDCKVIDCDRCGLRHINEKNCRVAFEKWLDEETGVDWETLPIDTKIIVRYPNSKMDIMQVCGMVNQQPGRTVKLRGQQTEQLNIGIVID